jgi:hypothetical protein
MKLQMDPDALAAFNETLGFLPPRKSSLEKAEYMKSPVMQKVGQNMATFGEPFKTIPVWQQFDRIIKPMIEAAVLGVKTVEQALTEGEKECAYIMTEGGPVNSTLFYVPYLYQNAFRFFEMGYASALAWILFFVILAFAFVQFRMVRRWVYYEAPTPVAARV